MSLSRYRDYIDLSRKQSAGASTHMCGEMPCSTSIEIVQATSLSERTFPFPSIFLHSYTRGALPEQRQVLYQLCDLQDDDIQSVLLAQGHRGEYSVR